jgi:CHASE3 domain sensor protein
MRTKTTLHGQLVAFKLMPIVLLVIAFASAIQLWIHTVDAIAKAEPQTAVISSAQVLLEKVLDAETGARGYAATARTVFLEPYNGALLAIPAAVQRLSTLVAGDATQARYARRVKTLSARKLAILGSYVASMQAGRPQQARAEVARACSCGRRKNWPIGPRLDGIDEISDLDRAFHDMAELLAERTGDLERYRLLAESLK